ncbi:transcriptional regulator [Prauserella marina]|nr:helix-turn-helix transcriptional regulator [Prauserella marina]ASR39227.1 transcriptional regulator [Prauserella marina]
MSAVGSLLREWRNRRRLSQLDLANAAEVSARHVSLVETGNSRPSANMILRLAEKLDVPLRERNRLLRAGGFAERFPERPLDDDALATESGALRRVLHAHEPYPAVVLDRGWNVVMANRAVTAFLADTGSELTEPPMNLVRLGLDPRGLAGRIVNLTEVRSVFRRRIARQLAIAPDPELSAVYEEYLAAEPGQPLAESESDIVIPMIIRAGGRVLRLFSTITTFGTPMDVTLAEIAVESYYPQDDETDDYFRGLMSQ